MANMSVCIAYPHVYEIVQISELGSAETLFFSKKVSWADASTPDVTKLGIFSRQITRQPGSMYKNS